MMVLDSDARTRHLINVRKGEIWYDTPSDAENPEEAGATAAELVVGYFTLFTLLPWMILRRYRSIQRFLSLYLPR